MCSASGPRINSVAPAHRCCCSTRTDQETAARAPAASRASCASVMVQTKSTRARPNARCNSGRNSSLTSTVRRRCFNVPECFGSRAESDAYCEATLTNLQAVGARCERLTQDELRARFPQLNFDGVDWAVFENDAGVLMARRAVQAVAHEGTSKRCRLRGRSDRCAGYRPKPENNVGTERSAPNTWFLPVAHGCQNSFPTCSPD